MTPRPEISELEKWEHWRSQTVAERHAFFLERAGNLRTPGVIEAFREVDRADFLRPNDMHMSMVDMPIPIGHEQTNSQPTLVAEMMEQLDVRPGHRVLDVGTGSGWTTALLGRLAGEDGLVRGIERIPELADRTKVNLGKYRGLEGIRIRQSEELDACRDDGPFDRILVSASAEELPQKLVGQLADGGRMVLPIRKALMLAERRDGTADVRSVAKGVDFVPLIVDAPSG